MTVPQIIWQAAGSPEMLGRETGLCRACGLSSRGISFSRWVRPTFTDFDKLLPGDIICHACQFCFTDANGLLARLVGKDKPQRMRNYAHFVVDGEWLPCSLGDRRKILSCLLREPQVAIIAISGQKHLITRARPGWWQIEDQSALPFPGALVAAMRPIERLYAAGFSKCEIASGSYSQSRIKRFCLDERLECEREIKPLRGSLEFYLALFLATKEQRNDA